MRRRGRLRAIRSSAVLLGALLVVPALSGCAAPAAPATPRPSACASGTPAPDPSPRPAQPVDGGTPPPAPVRVEIRTGERPDEAEVRVVPVPGTRYESEELRWFVDGCAVPDQEEGDELPVHVRAGLARGDRLQVLARLNGLGGNSAETASAVHVQP